MSFPYLRLFTGDYLRDTRHLTPMRHGVYLLLLMHCWDQKGPLPLDEQECAGIANCRSADEISALHYVIERYFVRLDDGCYNKRMQREIEAAAAISEKRSTAASERWAAREALRKIDQKGDAGAMQLHSKRKASGPAPAPAPAPAFAAASTPAPTPAEPVLEKRPVRGSTAERRKPQPLPA